MGVLVEPRIGSYVTEWEAIQFDVDQFGNVRKLLRGSSWVAQLILDEAPYVQCTRVRPNTIFEMEKTYPGDWIVKSPHGRIWFMSDPEFQSQFHTWGDRT